MKNSYSKIINEYTEKMIKTFPNELMLLLIIGSSCSDRVMENWSDIDVILVIKYYDFNTIEKIKLITNSFNVKIGTTIYSEKEFSLEKIDPKTYFHLYLVNQNLINIQYKCSNLVIPKITFEELSRIHTEYLNIKLHEYKRLFLYDRMDKELVKKIFKMTYIIMKIILIINKFTPKNYDDVFHMYSEKFGIEYYDYEQFIYNYKNNIDAYKNIIEYAKNFITTIV